MQNSQPLDLEEALSRLYHTLPQMNRQMAIQLTQAQGHILAENVSAPGDLPPFNASAMDGYALRQSDFQHNPQTKFTVVGTSRAGHPYPHAVGRGECVRIFTGAKVPEGADQVILQEECAEPVGTGADATSSNTAAVDTTYVQFKPHTPSESYVRPIGHDVKRGVLLASKGDYLNGFALGSLAASGVSEVQVYAKPRVGVFSTGDELVDPGTPLESLAEGQIYDSNRFTVLSLLRHSPCELIDLGRLPDDAAAVEEAFQRAAQQCQMLITSGGVSVGDADFVTATIETLGQLDFWRLNLKPGKPLAFGQIGDCYVFGLPGNPVSTIVTLLLLAKPAIWHYAGAHPHPPLRIPAALDGPLHHTPGRTEFQRGVLTQQQHKTTARVTGDQSSNRLSTFFGANCLIEVPKNAGDLTTGAQVWVLPFTGLLD